MTIEHAGEPSAAQIAARYGMQRAGARPSLPAYMRQLWGRRQFIWVYSVSRNAATNSGSFLGEAWNVLTPLLNAGVYFLVFGLLLDTKRGVDNFIAFLVIGVFFFEFCARAVNMGSKAITSNLGLLRSLHFPRAVLPIAITLTSLQQLLYSMVVVFVVVLATGEPLTWQWFELIPALALQTLFCFGLAMLFARIGAHLPDASQLLPFATRVWLYTSGVLYSIHHFTADHPSWVRTVLDLNPGAIYVDLARSALIDPSYADLSTWLLGLAWGVGIFVIGFVVFWQGEEEYGRV